jgi:hypothetical protein
MTLGTIFNNEWRVFYEDIIWHRNLSRKEKKRKSNASI